MTVARCDDPNCTCRSPDLQWFTNQVLRRDGTKTDYIVIPLIGGVLARCLIAEDAWDPRTEAGPGQDELIRQAQAVVELATRADAGDTWEDETHAYGIIADLVFCNWPGVMSWGSMSYFHKTVGLSLRRRAGEEIPATIRFLSSNPPPSWTESVIIATYGLLNAGDRNVPTISKRGRPVRVALADRLRRDGLVTWPRVLAAAVNDWTTPTLERLARHQALAGDAAIHYVMDLEEAKAAKEAKEAAKAAEGAPASAPDIAPANEDDEGESRAAERLVEDAVAEIEHWRSQRDRVQRERDLFAGRDARSRSRAESLERERDSARRTAEQVERELRAVGEERDRLAERLAATEAVADDAKPASLPANLLAGRRVLLFTGVDNAEIRTELTKGFWGLGAAQVDCYWTDKARGPDAFPSDAIIVADVTFMSHSDSDSVQVRARAAGAWYYCGRHGAATLSRAVAAAWAKHLEH